MSCSRRVVLTGIGVLSPLGLDLASFRLALRQGRSGIRPFRSFDPSALPVRIAGEVDGFDPRNYLDRKDRKSIKLMARTVQLAVAGSRLALEDAALVPATLDPTRFGITFGIGTIPGDLSEPGPASWASRDPETGTFDLHRWGTTGMYLLPPMFMLNHVPNMASCHVSILHDARGPNNTITQTDAAGLLALGEAMNVIQREAADVVLAGGADTRTPLVMMVRYPLFSQLSKRNDEPEKACRPFDLARDGQVMSEGAGIFVVEDLEHARRRGARIHAEIIGYAAGHDRGRSGTGLARVIQTALKRAGVGPEEIDHVNAHAPGTTEDDAWEARGIAQALGAARVPVLAVKSYLGNVGTAGSSIELAASLTCMAEGFRPGTLNHEVTDPSCPVHVLREAGSTRRSCVLKVAGTDKGQCAALVSRRWQQ